MIPNVETLKNISIKIRKNMENHNHWYNFDMF